MKFLKALKKTPQGRLVGAIRKKLNHSKGAKTFAKNVRSAGKMIKKGAISTAKTAAKHVGGQLKKKALKHLGKMAVKGIKKYGVPAAMTLASAAV